MHVSIIHHSHTACYRVRGSCYNPLAFPFQSYQVETRFRMNMRWSLQTTRAFHSIPNRERERTVFSRIKPIYHRNKDVSICIQTPKKSLIGEASARHWKGEKINDHPHNEINQNANEIINRSFVSEGEGKNNVLEYQIATEKGFFLLRDSFRRQIFIPYFLNSSSILNWTINELMTILIRDVLLIQHILYIHWKLIWRCNFRHKTCQKCHERMRLNNKN